MSARPSPIERLQRAIRDRFSPQEALGLHLTIGVLVILLAGWCFSEIAENLGPTTAQVALDQRVTNWFHAHARAQLTVVARAITFCGSVGFVAAVSLACAVYFAARRAWNRFIALLATVLGGSLLNILLKHFFHRHRPVLENPLVTLSSFGFPSGHTMGATLLYGLLALIALRFVKRAGTRIALVTGAIVLIALIGLTRIYLGAHFLSDVLGAIAIGVAWLALCWTAAETFRKRRGRASAR